jgi:hypothetical protein
VRFGPHQSRLSSRSRQQADGRKFRSRILASSPTLSLSGKGEGRGATTDSSRSARRWRVIPPSALLVPVTLWLGLSPVAAWSHGFAGKRFFPATLATDDPFVNDEGGFLLSNIKEPGSGDEPATLATEISGEWAKRITPDFGLTVGGAFQHLDPSGEQTVNGFANLELGAKYQFLTNVEHEAILSVGVGAEVGGTGAERVGADPFSTVSPTFFFGKGMGDLPDSVKMLRPIAITGVLGVDFPTVSTDEQTGERPPTTLSWGFSVQYNLQYLQSFVRDVGLGPPFNRMIPLVEFPMETCINRACSGQTTGFVDPGVIWFGKYIQLGLEAQIPLNSRTGDNVGVLVQVHLFLDDLFPKSIGRPLFGASAPKPAWWGGSP